MMLSAQEEIEIKSNKKITLKVGSSEISLDESGNIEIKGKEIQLKSASNVLVIN